jgi:hypothetical protein
MRIISKWRTAADEWGNRFLRLSYEEQVRRVAKATFTAAVVIIGGIGVAGAVYNTVNENTHDAITWSLVTPSAIALYYGLLRHRLG